MRSPAGEDMVLKNNFFVERILPLSIIRKLSDDEMNAYRKPYTEAGESRRPMLTWPREIPIEGEPKDVTEIANNYSKPLAKSPPPNPVINPDPCAVFIAPVPSFCPTFPTHLTSPVTANHSPHQTH